MRKLIYERSIAGATNYKGLNIITNLKHTNQPHKYDCKTNLYYELNL